MNEPNAETPPPATPPGAPPAAASTVVSGEHSERENTLQKLLRERELELARLQDENHRLKTPLTPAQIEKASFLDGATFWG
jgi:hypothetical protein